MFPYMPLESALEMLVVGYVASGMLVMAASKVCLAVIEEIEEVER